MVAVFLTRVGFPVELDVVGRRSAAAIFPFGDIELVLKGLVVGLLLDSRVSDTVPRVGGVAVNLDVKGFLDLGGAVGLGNFAVAEREARLMSVYDGRGKTTSTMMMYDGDDE